MVKKAKSSFLERVAEVHEEVKGNETKVGSGGDLPPGIEHGIARLVDCKIGIFQKGDNEGEPFFMAAGTVLDPESVVQTDPKTKKARTIPIRGLRTQIGPEPLCDTTAQNGNVTSLRDHWDRVLNHLRLLGIDTKEVDPTDIIAEETEGVYSSGPVLEALVAAAPTFRFRTWQGKPTDQYPNPRVNHEWRGACEYEGDATSEEVQDDTEAKWESDEQADAAAEEEKAPPRKPPKAPAKAEDAKAEESGSIDFMALGKLADAGKPKKEAGEASKTLAGHAKVLGIDGYEDMDTWVDVAQAIIDHEEIVAEEEAEPEEEAEAEEEYVEEEAEAEEEEWSPAEGEMGFFMAPGSKKPVECEFVKVYGKAQKVDLKRNDTKKIVKGVPFAKVGPTDDGPPF